ncbi:MAG: hypothetical protein ACRD12_02835 [Acidimicrobiales bacterium]
MALNKDALKTDLLAMMSHGRDPGWDEDKAADALATAIDTYVRAGLVRGVRVQRDNLVLDQSNEVHLQ